MLGCTNNWPVFCVCRLLACCSSLVRHSSSLCLSSELPTCNGIVPQICGFSPMLGVLLGFVSQDSPTKNHCRVPGYPRCHHHPLRRPYLLTGDHGGVTLKIPMMESLKRYSILDEIESFTTPEIKKSFFRSSPTVLIQKNREIFDITQYSPPAFFSILSHLTTKKQKLSVFISPF